MEGTGGTTCNAPAKAGKNKLLHIELLRIISIWFVIYNHTDSIGFYLFAGKEGTPMFYVYAFISVLCKIAVPIFFMISGALLIPKEEDIKTIFKKRVFRIIVVLVAFSFPHYLYGIYKSGEAFSLLEFFKIIYSREIVSAYWFLYTYLGILLMLPLLRKLAKAMNSTDYKYLFICHLLFVAIIPLAGYLIWQGEVSLTRYLAVELFTSRGIFYFLMGHYIENMLSNDFINKKNLAIMGVLSVILIIITTLTARYVIYITGINVGGPPQLFFNSFITIPSITAYLAAKYFFQTHNVGKISAKIIAGLGSVAFGVMLLESFIMLKTEFIPRLLMPYIRTLPACIIWVTLVVLIGGAITWVLKKIPVVKKFL